MKSWNLLSSFPIAFLCTYILIVNGDSLAASAFMCADMLVDTPVTPPTTANTPLASGRAQKVFATTQQLWISHIAQQIFMDHTFVTITRIIILKIRAAIRHSLRSLAVYTLLFKLKCVLTACAPRVAGPSCNCRRWILSQPPSHWWNAATGSPPQTLHQRKSFANQFCVIPKRNMMLNFIFLTHII